MERKRKGVRPPAVIVALAAALIVFVAPRAVADSIHGSFEEAIHHFAHLDPSRSLVELLPLRASLRGTQRAAATFLIGNALAELGLQASAIRELRRSLDDGDIEPSAVIALTRIYSDLQADRELLDLVDHVRWARFGKEDRAEIAYRAGRACYRQERFFDTRRWLARIPPDSSFEPFGAYLLAQTEFAVGKYGRAIAAAKPILSERARDETLRVLQDRAAIFLGDLYTELGHYQQAVENLRRPDRESPFAARARRDLLVAEGLADLSTGKFESAAPVVERLHGYLVGLGDEIARSVSSPQDVNARAQELRGVWPPKFVSYGRRDWAVARVEGVLEKDAPPRPGGLMPILAYAPAIWRFEGGRWKIDPWLPERERTSRFFFPPTGEIARILLGLALLEEPAAIYGTPCAIRAATSIRQRIAGSLLDDLPSPTVAELEHLASTCDLRPPRADLLADGRARLHDSIRAEARRLQDQSKRDRLEIELAIGRAYLKHVERLEAARRQAQERAEADSDAHRTLARR